jgi:hypothetical protein
MGSLAFVLAALVQAATGAPAAPAAPAAPQPFDLNSKLINTPDSNWSIYGPNQTSKRIEKGGPKNYPAYEVNIARPAPNAWDDGAVSPIPKPIGAGDVILVAVYLRNPGLADGQSETLPLIGATGASAPYPGIAGAPAKLTNQWQVYFASGKSPQAFPANGAQATVHLGSAKHTIQLGPVKVYDLGADFDMRRLPH